MPRILRGTEGCSDPGCGGATFATGLSRSHAFALWCSVDGVLLARGRQPSCAECGARVGEVTDDPGDLARRIPKRLDLAIWDSEDGVLVASTDAVEVLATTDLKLAYEAISRSAWWLLTPTADLEVALESTRTRSDRQCSTCGSLIDGQFLRSPVTLRGKVGKHALLSTRAWFGHAMERDRVRHFSYDAIEALSGGLGKTMPTMARHLSD